MLLEENVLSFDRCICTCFVAPILVVRLGGMRMISTSLLHSLRVLTTGLVVPSCLALVDYAGLCHQKVREHLQLSFSD